VYLAHGQAGEGCDASGQQQMGGAGADTALALGVAAKGIDGAVCCEGKGVRSACRHLRRVEGGGNGVRGMGGGMRGVDGGGGMRGMDGGGGVRGGWMMVG